MFSGRWDGEYVSNRATYHCVAGVPPARMTGFQPRLAVAGTATQTTNTTITSQNHLSS